MRHPILLFLALLPGLSCGSKAPAPAPVPAAPARTGRLIQKLQLSESEASHVEFESAYCKGAIEILPGVRIGYASVAANGETHQALTLEDKQFLFDGPELLIGPKSYGKLEGEVRIVIAREGVTVNGERRGAL